MKEEKRSDTQRLAEGQLTLNKLISGMLVRQIELTRVVDKLVDNDRLLLETMCASQGIDLEEIRKELQDSGESST